MLIKAHLEPFQAEFENLLDHEKDDDLKRMFQLCERVEGALEELKVILEAYIKRKGKDAVEKVASTAINVRHCNVVM